MTPIQSDTFDRVYSSSATTDINSMHGNNDNNSMDGNDGMDSNWHW